MRTEEAFWARVDVADLDDCWEWTGARNNSGYGTLKFQGVHVVAHRVAAYLVGLVEDARAPEDRCGPGFVLHQCDNPACCNPTHFLLGTFSQNQKEAYERNRRQPRRGHMHRNAKLTQLQAEEVRQRYGSGELQVPLAREYGVSQRVISLITRGEAYIEFDRSGH